MSTYKASIYNYLFNSINAIIVIVNGIVMVPIYFHYMSVSTYGAWLATGNVVAMLGLLESGFSSVITQKMAAAIGRKDDDKYQRLAGANIITAIIIASSIFLIGICFTPFITDWINVDEAVSSQIRQAYAISLVSSCVAVCVSLFGAFPQVWQDTKSVGIINICSGLAAIGSLVIFLISGFGVVSIALSYLVRSSLNLVVQGSWIIRKRKRDQILPPIYSLRESVALAKDCVYPFLSRLSGVIMGNSQSFIIAHFMNPALAAVYDLTAKVCYVACSFVSQTNGSFFALFSITLSSGDRQKIDSVFANTSKFFVLSLIIVSVFSICFTEPVINYWVGLDKYGGTWLLVVIVLAKILFQFRSYCNNILYTGGMINKSAKLDILCAFVYLGILLAIITHTQIYALPIATLVTSLLFIVWYLRLMKKYLYLDIKLLAGDFIKCMAISIPFVIIHFLLKMDYHNLILYIGYFVVFSIVYFITLFVANKAFFILLLSKFRKK